MASNNEGPGRKYVPPFKWKIIKTKLQKTNFRWFHVSSFVCFLVRFLSFFSRFFFSSCFLFLFLHKVFSRQRPTKIAQVFVKWQWHPKTNMKGGRRDRRSVVILALKKMRRWERCMLTGGVDLEAIVFHDGSNIFISLRGHKVRRFRGKKWGGWKV